MRGPFTDRADAVERRLENHHSTRGSNVERSINTSMEKEITMNQDEFVAALKRDGFGEIVTVERQAGGSLDVHTHPFEARALILAGEIRIGVDGILQTYRAGDIFRLSAEEAHSESYGPEGVTYLVGRR